MCLYAGQFLRLLVAPQPCSEIRVYHVPQQHQCRRTSHMLESSGGGGRGEGEL